MSGRLLINRNQMRFLIVGAAALAMSACSSSGDSASTSGTMSVTGSLTQNVASDLGNPVSMFEANFATSGTKISLDCGSSGVFSATVDPSSGAFTASGIPTGVPCTFNFVSSTNGATKCQVQFQDSSNLDLNNNPMSTGSAAASSSLALGPITCDTSGNVNITASGVSGLSSGGSVAVGTAFDFTGSWLIGAFDGTLPTGYLTPTCSGNSCQGPGLGQPISLVRFHGSKFTPSTGQCTPAINVSCPVGSGTVDATKDGYGMSIWGGDYAHGIGACGANTGFTADEARAYAHISLDATAPSLTGHQLNYAHFGWSAAPTGFGGDAGWTQPWMYTGATSSWAMQDCQPVSVPSTSSGANKPGYACFSQVMNNNVGQGTYVWNVGLANAGGCVDSNNQPVMVNNWSAFQNGSCTSSASSFNSHFQTNSCTYTGAPVAGQASITFTCSFTGGAFTDISAGTASTDNNGPNFSTGAYSFTGGNYPGQPAPLIAQNGTCKNATTSEATLITQATSGGTAALKAAASKELLARYQCYASQYWQHTTNGGGATTCQRNYNFDWSTNDYSKFVMGDDRSMKPQNAFITDRVFYSSDGQWAFLKNVDTKFQSIPTSSGSTLCPMKNITELKFKRVSDSKLLVNFTQMSVMADKSATCQAAVAAALAGGGTLGTDPTGLNNLYRDLQPQRMLFYLTK